LLAQFVGDCNSKFSLPVAELSDFGAEQCTKRLSRENLLR